MEEISLMLGAGFSVNQGYPTAQILNQELIGLSIDDFYIATDGNLVLCEKGQEDPFAYSDYVIQKHYLVELITFYRTCYCIGGEFSYEIFYDFVEDLFHERIHDAEFELFSVNFRNKYKIDDNNANLLSHFKNNFNQLIGLLVVDNNKNRYYKPGVNSGLNFDKYTGFIDCLYRWGKAGLVNIHTLNHDLFFEAFTNLSVFQGRLSDGFKELGSPYYGEDDNHCKIRLPCFVNEYIGQYRLYKLHGSFDYYPFHSRNNAVENFVKKGYGISESDVYKEEVSSTGDRFYVRDFINYHPDFLSGTTSKILRYKEKPYYGTVFYNLKKI